MGVSPPLTPTPRLPRQDTVTGFLLAGVGHRTVNTTNFLVVKQGEMARDPDSWGLEGRVAGPDAGLI